MNTLHNDTLCLLLLHRRPEHIRASDAVSLTAFLSRFHFFAPRLKQRAKFHSDDARPRAAWATTRHSNFRPFLVIQTDWKCKQDASAHVHILQRPRLPSVLDISICDHYRPMNVYWKRLGREEEDRGG